MSIPQLYTHLTTDDLDEAFQAWQQALYHLAMCWNALHTLEGLLGNDVETEHIDSGTGDLGPADEAFGKSQDDFLEWLDVFAASTKTKEES